MLMLMIMITKDFKGASQYPRMAGFWNVVNLLLQFCRLIGFHCLEGPDFSKHTNLVPRVSHLTTHWSEQGETLFMNWSRVSQNWEITI